MSVWPLSRPHPATIRLAAPADRPALAALLAETSQRHGLAAVEEQVALLNSGLSTIAFAGENAVGFLGLSPRLPAGDPGEQWVDLPLVAVADGEPAHLLRSLLGAALPYLSGYVGHGQPPGKSRLMCLCSERWLRDALQDAGFIEEDRVLCYMRLSRRELAPSIAVARLRPAGPPDADAVLSLNAAAFAPMWRYDPATLLSWLLTADHAIVAEQHGRLVGFALTTSAALDGRAQLIRIATHPEAQRQGIGRQMVADAIRFACDQGAISLTLNTQASNRTSRQLYEAMGFRPSGVSIAVLVYRTG